MSDLLHPDIPDDFSTGTVALQYGPSVDEPTPKDGETSAKPASSPPAHEPAAEGGESSSTPTKPVDESTQEGSETRVSELPVSNAEPPKKPRRSNEFWLAVLGIISTMVVGITGAVSTYLTGAEHDRQESIRAQHDFARSQQVQAYTNFSNAVTDFVDASISEWQTVKEQTMHFAAPAYHIPAKHNLAEAFLNMLDANTAVVFNGSSDVQQAAHTIVDKADHVRGGFSKWEEEHLPGSPPATDEESASFFAHELKPYYDELERAHDDFTAAARKDLGLSGSILRFRPTS